MRSRFLCFKFLWRIFNMQIQSNIFREYDIRGNADKELTDESAYAIGRAFGTWLKRHDSSIKKISIGGDARLSTERIRQAVITGILKSGLDVINVGLVTTPMLYWTLKYFNLNGGVMITGSHNPPEMNGLKLCFGNGTLYGSQIQEIKNLITNDDFESGEGVLEAQNIDDDYLKMLVSKFKLPFNKKFKVVCDSGNGAAGLTAGKYFNMLGCECVSLFEEPDGNFPNHHPDPQKRENLKFLIERVFDGDADRLGVVDNKGNVIFGDRLMVLYWREILKNHPGAVVLVEPKCSMVLPEEVERLGGEVMYWKSGHSLIKAKMHELKALFSGEYSGHMFFADEFFGHDDAFYSAARVLRIMSNENKSLAELSDSVAIYPSTEEIRVPCEDNIKFEVVERIKNKALEKYKCSVIDGVRILYDDGWGLIRASNTQPVITVRCEGKNKNALERIMADIKARVLAENLPDFKWTF